MPPRKDISRSWLRIMYGSAETDLSPSSTRRMLPLRAAGQAADVRVMDSSADAAFRDRDARIERLDAFGVQACVMFSSFFFENEFGHDPEAGCANLRAYNRWVAEDWGFHYRERLFAPATISLIDLDFAVEELERVLADGARLLLLRTGPVSGRSPADIEAAPATWLQTMIETCEPKRSPPPRVQPRSTGTGSQERQEHYAKLKHTRFKVGKAPIFYLPWLLWPVKTDRASGFLMPDFGNSNSRGYFLGTALFWAMRRNMDTTFYMDYYSIAGPAGGLEYRYVSDYLGGAIKSRNDLMQKLASAICQFARRQDTWFRRIERKGAKIQWVDRGDPDAAMAIYRAKWHVHA